MQALTAQSTVEADLLAAAYFEGKGITYLSKSNIKLGVKS